VGAENCGFQIANFEHGAPIDEVAIWGLCGNVFGILFQEQHGLRAFGQTFEMQR